MAVGLVVPGVASAATTVNCNTTSLISAINAANASGGGVLDLPAGCVYTLTDVDNYYQPGDPSTGRENGLPVITGEVTINGHGASIVGPPGPYGLGFFDVSGTLVLNQLTLSGGFGYPDGGAVSLRLAATVKINDSTLTNNYAEIGGGAIATSPSSVLIVNDSTFSGNSGGFGLGGAIMNHGSTTVHRSTLSNNSAPMEDFGYGDGGSGGAIYSDGELNVDNSTFTANSAKNDGGAISSRGGTITLSTIVANVAGDGFGGASISASSSDPVSISQSILANNSPNCNPNSGGYIDNGYNIADDSTCGLSASTSRSNTNPQLGPLQANGGPTMTMAPLVGSPTINAGPGTCTPPVDQRGFPRPFGPACDVGAFEVGSPSSADLVVSALNNPPVFVIPGSAFSVTDTTANYGGATVGASSTRYYLSTDRFRNTGDRLLTGARPVPVLAANASNAGSVSVTVPANAALGTYYLLACADDRKVRSEASESNNCRSSVSKFELVSTPRPDLVVSAVAITNPPPSVPAGGTVFITDTTANNYASAPASTTRYYLSADPIRNTGDKLLPGGRKVPTLAAGASNTGGRSVTIPTSTTPGRYLVLACADDLKVVTEADETNNCRSTSTQIEVVAAP